jgi:hypothetical protein
MSEAAHAGAGAGAGSALPGDSMCFGGSMGSASASASRSVDTGSVLDDGFDMHISKHLNLDNSTLVNLEILANTVDGSRAGSLLASLEQCITAQGKRLFTVWLCAPLRLPKDINDRYVGGWVGFFTVGRG